MGITHRVVEFANRQVLPISTILSSSFANINHCIVEFCQYQPFYHHVLPISTLVSYYSFANINHCIVDSRQYQPLHRRFLRILSIVSSIFANINHFIVKFCQYQPLHGRGLPISTIVSSSFANITHCVVKVNQYQPLCRRGLPVSTTVSSSFTKRQPLYLQVSPISILMSSSLANINNCSIIKFCPSITHGIVKVCQYQPWCRQGLPISTTVSIIVEFCQCQALYRHVFANIDHCIVDFCQYQPLYRHVRPISTILSPRCANTNHCVVNFCQHQHYVVEVCQYQPLCSGIELVHPWQVVAQACACSG